MHYALVLASLLAYTIGIFGDVAPSRSELEKIVRTQGANLYTLAWPTATFRRVDIESVEFAGSGADLTVVLRGTSAFTNSELWARALVKMRGRQFVNLKWKEHNSSLFPPGSTVSDLPEALDKINKGKGPHDFRSNARPDQEKWTEFDARMRRKWKDYQSQTRRLSEQQKRGPTRLTVKTSPGCRVVFALHFTGLDGRSVTTGWYTADDESWLELYPKDSNIWLYGQATRGRLWSGRPRNPLRLPVIRGRGFIQTGTETLAGPDLETVEFFKLHGREYTFGCTP